MERARRRHHVGFARNARERFLDAFETSDRRVELFAHGRIGAADARHHLCRADAQGRQRDRATGGEALHQHAPAVPNTFAAADDAIQRREYILADDGAIHERHAHRIVALTDFHAPSSSRGMERTRCEVLDVAEQVIRVLDAESEPDQGRDRRQRDIAFFPVQAQADFLAVDGALFHDAFGLRRRRVGTGFRSGQAEAGNLVALCQSRQIIFFLFFGAVVQQQLAGAK